MSNENYTSIKTLFTPKLFNQATLGILHNALRRYEQNRQVVRLNDGINSLHKYYSSTFLIVKAKIMILLSYCVNEEENQRLTTGLFLF